MRANRIKIKKRMSGSFIFAAILMAVTCLSITLHAIGTAGTAGIESSGISTRPAAFGLGRSEFSSADVVFKDISVNDINSNGFLGLINADYPVKAAENPETVPAFKIIPISTSDLRINPVVLESVDMLFTEAESADYTGFLVNSGYRTEEKQMQLYDDSADKDYVQKPGHSEHQTGLAVDIAYKGISGKDMAFSNEGEWLRQNAWKYGFILRYPEDKSDITGIAFEPWHFRYVGLPHAYFCYENGLCLEEYIDFLRESGSYTVEVNEKSYKVFYKTPENGIIQAPVDMEYVISSDNAGGYVITAEVD